MNELAHPTDGYSFLRDTSYVFGEMEVTVDDDVLGVHQTIRRQGFDRLVVRKGDEGKLGDMTSSGGLVTLRYLSELFVNHRMVSGEAYGSTGKPLAGLQLEDEAGHELGGRVGIDPTPTDEEFAAAHLQAVYEDDNAEEGALSYVKYLTMHDGSWSGTLMLYVFK